MSIFSVLGKLAKTASPILAATGVGAPIAAGVGAAGSLLDRPKRQGNIFSRLGHMVSSPNVLGNQSGRLDLSKLFGLAGGVSNFVGAQKQRKQAERYNNAMIDQRNQLMSRILSGQNYGLPAPNLNEQSSATRGY